MRIISLEDGKQVAKETTDPVVKGQIKQDLGLDKVENKTDAERVQSGPIKQALDNKVTVGENGKAFSPIGSYNASSNTATKNDGSTSSLNATPDNTLADGSTYRIITAGTLGFAGRNFASGQAVNVGDELTKFGTQWALTLFAQNTSKIASWIPQSYAINSQVNYLGKDFVNTNVAYSSDIPGESEVWVPRLNVYSKEEIDEKSILSFSENEFPDFVGYPTTQPTVENDIITLDLSLSTSDFGVAISSEELHYIEFELVKPYICIGIDITNKPVCVCVVTGQFCGQVRTIDERNGYNQSNNLGVFFPSDGIPLGAIIRIEISLKEISVYYSVDFQTWILWGTILKENIPQYKAQKIGFLGYKTDTNNSIKVYRFEYLLKRKNKIDVNSIESVMEAKNYFVPILPLDPDEFDNNIRKIEIEKFFDSNEKLIFKNPPEINFDFFPVAATLQEDNGTILANPPEGTNFACFFSRFEVSEMIISRNNSYIVIGLDINNFPIIIAMDGGIAGQIRRFKNGNGYNLVNNIATASNTNNVPTTATKVKINIENENIIISYSIDGQSYTIWNNIAKSNVGSTYKYAKIGALTYNISTKLYDYKVGSSGTGVVLKDNFIKSERRNSTKILVIDSEKEGGAGYINIERIFDGKKGFSYGDSMSTNVEGANLYYTPLLVEMLGLADCKNFGIGGKTLANDLSKNVNIDNIIAYSPDVVFLLGGTNDFGGNAGSGSQLGVETSMNDGVNSGTTLGGLAYIINRVNTFLPETTIVVVTPLPRFYNSDEEMYTQNQLGYTLSDYVDGIKKVARRYSCLCIDAYGEIGINKFNRTKYLKDNVHPNQKGYKKLCELIAGKLK